MFAIASVTDVNAVEFAMHAVLIVTAFGYAAGYAAVDFTFHFRPSFPIILNDFAKFILHGLTNPSLFSKIEKKERKHL